MYGYVLMYVAKVSRRSYTKRYACVYRRQVAS